MKRSDFISDEKLKDLLQFAMDLPEQYRTLAEQAHDAFRQEIAECENRIDNIKAETEFLVRGELDDNGKLKYGNQKLRDAAVATALLGNQDYQAELKSLDRYKTERNRLWREKDQCEMRFKGALRNLDVAVALTYSENLTKEHSRDERIRHAQAAIS